MAKEQHTSLLLGFWDRAIKAMGPIAAIVPVLAKSIKVDLKAEDVTAARGRVVELQEAAAALGGLASHLESALADGTVTLEEGAGITLKVEAFIDQIEDVVKGYDEDKKAVKK